MFAAQRVQREIQPQAGQASTGAYPRRFKNEALFAASQAFLDGGDQWLADPSFKAIFRVSRMCTTGSVASGLAR